MHEQWTLVSGVAVAPHRNPRLGGAAGVWAQGQPAPIKAHLNTAVMHPKLPRHEQGRLCLRMK